MTMARTLTCDALARSAATSADSTPAVAAQAAHPTDPMQDFDRRWARDQQAHRERLARILWQGRVTAQRSRTAHEARMRAFFTDLRQSGECAKQDDQHSAMRLHGAMVAVAERAAVPTRLPHPQENTP